MRSLATDMVFLPLLSWGSLFALLYIHDWILYRVGPIAPATRKAEALIREWLSPAQLRDYEKFSTTHAACTNRTRR